MLKKVVLWLAVALGVIVAGFAIFVAMRQHLTFDTPYPAIAASTDPAVIERGRYVVRILANCSECHGDPARRAEAGEGKEIPLSGGFVWNIPPGAIYARNITPDSSSGLGSVSDAGDRSRAPLRRGARRTSVAAVHGGAGALG